MPSSVRGGKNSQLRVKDWVMVINSKNLEDYFNGYWGYGHIQTKKPAKFQIMTGL